MKRHLRRERSLASQVARLAGLSIALGAAAVLTASVLPSARRYMRMRKM